MKEEREEEERRGRKKGRGGTLIIKVFVASECVGLPLCNLRLQTYNMVSLLLQQTGSVLDLVIVISLPGRWLFYTLVLAVA